MKFAMALSALLALGSVAALAAETKAPAPVQMTAAEMDKVVAGADRIRLQNPIRQRLKDGTCVNK